jgi:ankyrin repeat protein
MSKRFSLVELLLQKQANVNELADDGSEYMPLHFASEKFGGEVAVLALVKAGANVNAQTVHGDTALHLAGQRGLVHGAHWFPTILV